MKKIFHYLSPVWSGNDDKISLRSVLSIAFSVDIIRNIHFAVTKWGTDKPLDGLAMVIGIEASLVAALLALKTLQNAGMKLVSDPETPTTDK